MNLNMNLQKSGLVSVVLVSVLVSIAVVVGGFYFADVGEKLSAVPGPTQTENCISIGGVETCTYRLGMAATSTSLCVLDVTNTIGATSSIEFLGTSVTANRTGANQTVDISTTTATGGFGSSSPPIVLGWGLTTTGSGSSWGRHMAWFPSTATTTKTGGASGAGILEAFNSVTGQSNVIVRPGERLTWRVATATVMTVTDGTNDIDGFCNVKLQKL